MRVALTTVLELLGMVLLVSAAFFTDWQLGVAVLGVLLMWQAYRLEDEVES